MSLLQSPEKHKQEAHDTSEAQHGTEARGYKLYKLIEMCSLHLNILTQSLKSSSGQHVAGSLIQIIIIRASDECFHIFPVWKILIKV